MDSVASRPVAGILQILEAVDRSGRPLALITATVGEAGRVRIDEPINQLIALAPLSTAYICLADPRVGGKL